MGTTNSILLLDDHLPWHSPIIAKQAFAAKDSNHMSNIDSVYLVKVGTEASKPVSKIWFSQSTTGSGAS